MHRRRGSLPVLLMLLATSACGLRVDDSTRQALLQHELGPATGTGVLTPGQVQQGTTPGGATSATTTGGAISGSTGQVGTGTTGAPTTTTGSTSGGGATGTAGSTGVAPAPASGNGGATDIGVTATTVTVGTVADRSGPRPGLFDGTIAGVQAYFAYINSKGGVYGRTLQTSLGDSATACNSTADAHRQLVKKVFAFVGSFGVFDNCAAPVFQENPGIADVTYPISKERGSVKNNFTVQAQYLGAQAGPAVVFKQKFPGIEKHLGALIADVAASRSAWANLRSMYVQEGYTIAYEQFVAPTEVDYSRYVIGMRQAGVDMVVLTNDISGEVKFVNTAQQQGFSPKVITTRAVFYDPAFKDLIQGKGANVYAELGSALYFNADERRIPGVALFQDWMNKTSPKQAKDSFSVFGWCQAILFVDALVKAGPKATRPSLLAALQSIHTVDTQGLLPVGDPAGKKPTPCFIIANWSGSVWQRYSGPASGFDCSKPFDFLRP